MLAWNSWNKRITKLHEAETATANMAKALAQHAEDTIDGIDNVLVGLIETLEHYPSNTEQLDRLTIFMRQRVADLSLLHGLFIFDEHGKPVVTSREEHDGEINVTDREYFIFHRDHINSAPHLGPPVRSRYTTNGYRPYRAGWNMLTAALPVSRWPESTCSISFPFTKASISEKPALSS